MLGQTHLNGKDQYVLERLFEHYRKQHESSCTDKDCRERFLLFPAPDDRNDYRYYDRKKSSYTHQHKGACAYMTKIIIIHRYHSPLFPDSKSSILSLILRNNLLVISLLSAVRAYHFSGSAHVWCHDYSLHCRHIALTAIWALIVTGIVFDSKTDTGQNGY